MRFTACISAKMAAESMTSPGTGTSNEAIYSGQLWKKGGGTSKLGRRNWHRRWFDVRQRVLYYYASEAEMRQRKPKGSIYLSSAELIFVYDNSLSGTLPTQLLGGMPLLASLDVFGNRLSGTIGSEIGNATLSWLAHLASERA